MNAELNASKTPSTVSANTSWGSWTASPSRTCAGRYCLGLVRHLTMDIERFWFPGVIAGEPDVARQLTAGTEAHWQAPADMTAEEVFRDYRAAIGRANAVLVSTAERPAALDQEPAAWPADI